MKKLILCTFAVLFLLGLTACSSSVSTAPAASSATDASGSADGAASLGGSYPFAWGEPWPEAKTWSSFGLPDLSLSEKTEAKATVNHLAGVNGYFGLSAEITTTTSQVEHLVSILNNAKIKMEKQTNEENSYMGTYTYNYNYMRVFVSEKSGHNLRVLVESYDPRAK